MLSLIQVAEHATAVARQAAQQAPAVVQQVVPQVAPVIHVTVQQPLPGGMPEWVKILISAGVGALFAILGGVLMEFIKPKISNATLKKAIAPQLAFELETNWNVIDHLTQELAKAPKPEPHILCQAVLTDSGRLKWDRYEFYLAEERGCIYEMDPYGLFQDLLKMPTEMVEWSRRHRFDEVLKLTEKYKRLSRAMSSSLIKKPTGHMLFIEDSGQ
jgi:hypothetical protein